MADKTSTTAYDVSPILGLLVMLGFDSYFCSWIEFPYRKLCFCSPASALGFRVKMFIFCILLFSRILSSSCLASNTLCM